jgi:hypothetical protein
MASAGTFHGAAIVSQKMIAARVTVTFPIMVKSLFLSLRRGTAAAAYHRDVAGVLGLPRVVGGVLAPRDAG